MDQIRGPCGVLGLVNQRWGGEPVWLLVENRMVKINKFERTSWTGRPTHLHAFIRDSRDEISPDKLVLVEPAAILARK